MGGEPVEVGIGACDEKLAVEPGLESVAVLGEVVVAAGRQQVFDVGQDVGGSVVGLGEQDQQPVELCDGGIAGAGECQPGMAFFVMA